MGRAIVAVATVGGVCLGGAGALATVSGSVPKQLLGATPIATLNGVSAALVQRTSGQGTSGSTQMNVGSAPAVHGSTGASGATTNAGASARRVAPAVHTATGASGATGSGRAVSASRSTAPVAHGKSGASGATAGAGHEEDRYEDD